MAQIIYFSHGGGPLPILGDAGHKAMVTFMHGLGSHLQKPDAILVISAHWEEAIATVTSGLNPPLFFDYYGFPDEAYELSYPAPGNPDVAIRVAERLKLNDIPATLNAERGFDHGMFIPLKLMYPEAGIPVVQLSLLSSLDPAAHVGLGRALRELSDENILVLGSGFSFHNMRAFSWTGPDVADPQNDRFQDWLIDTCAGTRSQAEREQQLIDWENAPAARYCHPREEHLLPLHVCAGMAGTPATVIFDDSILGKRSVAFRWG